LWDRINTDFVLSDETSREALQQVCECADHVEELCQAIKRDSPIIETQQGMRKAHPAFQAVRQNRIFIVRALERLRNQHVKGVKVLGRPPVSMGFDPFEEQQT
jgi:hypothetical protein